MAEVKERSLNGGINIKTYFFWVPSPPLLSEHKKLVHGL